MTLHLAGIRAPRFVDIQARTLGHPVSADAPVLRGDLLFPDSGGVVVATDDRAVIRVGETVVESVTIDALGPIAVRRRLP